MINKIKEQIRLYTLGKQSAPLTLDWIKMIINGDKSLEVATDKYQRAKKESHLRLINTYRGGTNPND